MRKRKHQQANHDRWLVSYADFITLLFAFFVIMYAISSADAEKFKRLSESMQQQFGKGNAKPGGKSMGGGAGEGSGEAVKGAAEGSCAIDTAQERRELTELGDQMEKSLGMAFGGSDLADKIEITFENRGLVVRLSAENFYAPGQASVRPEALPVLDRIVPLLKGTPRLIRIEGHTDNTKTSSADFASNWELSTARATWIVRHLIQKGGIDPVKLEAAGYAEFRPIDSNATEAGRTRNRRVEILVLSKNPASS